MSDAKERQYTVLFHLSTIAMVLLSFIPKVGNYISFGMILIVFITWLIKRGGSVFVNQEGKRVLNLQLTIVILLLNAEFILIELTSINRLHFFTGVAPNILFLTGWAFCVIVLVYSVVFGIVRPIRNAIQVSQHQESHYTSVIRFFR